MRVDPYLRKSSADGGKSVSQQDDEVTDGITAEGWEVGRRFTDDNRSASRYARKKREDYEALVAHIASGACEALGIWEVARGGRRESTYFELLELCRARGTRIYVHTHGRLYDLKRRSDWKVFAQEVIEAADYSEKLSEASRRGKRAAARGGVPNGPLDGYTTRRNDLGKPVGRDLDPERAPIIRRMAAEALAGRTNSAIARGLNADGLLSSGGTAWRPAGITRILTNPQYAGIRVHRAGEKDAETFEGKWEPLISPENHRRLVQRLRDPERLMHNGSEPVWLLSGFGRCGVADCPGVVRVTRSNGAKRYCCRLANHLSLVAVETDEWVTEVVLARLSLPDAAEWFALRTDDATVAAAEREVADLEGQLAQWRELAKTRRVSPASFADFEADLLPKLEAANTRVRELSAPGALAHLGSPERAAKKWGELDVATRREIVKRVCRVTLLPAAFRGQRWTPDRVRIERP